MKLQTLLSAMLLALASVTAYAADADKAPAAEAKREAPAKTTKPHAHTQEKMGMSQEAPAGTPAKKNAAKDKTKHYHPRDMK